MSANARLSHAAVAYAASLPLREPRALAHRLYDFGYAPLTDDWLRAEAASGGAVQLLRVNRASATAPSARHWTLHLPAETGRPWLDWHRGGTRPAPRSAPTFKLYVAPIVAVLPEIAPVVTRELGRSRAFAFKLAATAVSLLRPDKIVAYFHRRRDLEEAAASLAHALDAVQAQPVPFTAALRDDGLLSWAMDPPATADDRADERSWRRWLTNRLATYLLRTRPLDDDARDATRDSVRHSVRDALASLEVDGVDVTTWAPHARRQIAW